MKRLSCFSSLFVLSFLSGCALDPPGTPPPGGGARPDFFEETAYDAWASYDAQGAVVDEGISELPEDRTGRLQTRSLALSDTAPSLHPDLAEELKIASDDSLLNVVIAVRSSNKLSVLPRYRRDLDLDDATNLEIETQRRLVQQADGELRALDRKPLVEAIERLGGKISAEYRVGNAVVVEITAGALRGLLAEHAEIAAASPVDSGEGPSASYISDGRAEQVSDQVVTAGYDATGYRVGLLDTGVYPSHTVFTSPNKILIWRDCSWTPMGDCSYYPVYPWNLYYNANDPVSSGGHGTGMADIIAGNTDLGDHYRGVAPGAYIDSVNVFSPTAHTALDQSAVLRAFNYLDAYDDVVVADITAGEYENGTIALAADDLYDEGVVVIAPVGNEYIHIAYSPAIAHKVLGIGGNGYGGSGGTNGGGRFKPDLTAPQGMYVAGNTGSTSAVYRTGTCPAAAFAGGAAALLRDYYDYRGWSTDPGAIYAAMITFGDEGGDDLDNNDGAGKLELGEVASSYWLSGVRYLDPGEGSDIYFYVGSGACDLRAGIWWAEDYQWDHSTLFLDLYQGSSLLRSSIHSKSVFQKVIYPDNMGSGWWRIHLLSYIYNTRQDIKVHYLVHYRTGC